MREQLAHLRNLVRRLVGIAHLGVVDDAGVQQVAQLHVAAGGPEGVEEVIDGVPRMGHYGVAYCPPDGSEAVVIWLGGHRSAGVVINTGHRPTRPTGLKPGEAMLYNGLTGDFVRMCEDGKIRSKGDWIHDGTLHTSKSITSELDVTDHTAADSSGGVSMKTHRDDYNAHKHTGVTAGAATSGPTDHPAT